ncbi:MAG: fatty acid desaturase, partial [Chloroflexi bacterium]|nr:fatty acid desaturase [Chloroflexota bacterium]
EEMDFLRRQVLTARNVKGHPITDLWYGGLNYQIEHHLFPNMPRNNLKEAQKIIRVFCEEHSISYHETGVVQSVKEILQYLHQESAPLRE